MGRKAKDDVVLDETLQDDINDVEQNEQPSNTVAMIRSADYPEPRTADVNESEVEEWSKFGWVLAE